MLTLQELKKNIVFFVIMTVVLSLLLSAGVSLFNFSFEINREILASFDREFEFGHEVRADVFVEYNEVLSQNGVLYTKHWGHAKSLDANFIDVFAIFPDVLSFGENLPVAVTRAKNIYNDFIVDGTLWNNTYGGYYDGGFPLFISDTMTQMASTFGLTLAVGDSITLYEYSHFDSRVVYNNFILRGIFRQLDTSYQILLPNVVTSIEAERAFRQAFNTDIGSTTFVVDSVENLRRFMRHADRANIPIRSWVAEDIGLVNLFSGIFASTAAVILILSGLIAFIYAGMLINKRMTFIGILKAMGMTNLRVTIIFFIMLLLAFIIAFLLGNGFSLIISAHFSYLAYSLFGFTLGIGFNFLAMGIFLGLVVVIVFLASLLLWLKIRRVSVSKVLTLRE